MGYGATGRILRVDLTRMHCHTEQLDEDVYRLYPGGKALAGYFMLREFVPGTDALSPDSVLVVANGLLTGAPGPVDERQLRELHVRVRQPEPAKPA